MFPVTVITRLGPWLGRLGPVALDGVYAALAKVGINVSTITQIGQYLSSNKTAVFTVFSTLASAGYAVSDMFSPSDKTDPEVRKTATELAVMEQQAIQARISKAAQQSETLSGLAGKGQDLRMLRDICVWARGHYGSAESALDAFNKQQAFFELSESDVKLGFELLA